MHTNRSVIWFGDLVHLETVGCHFMNEGHTKVVFNHQLASNLETSMSVYDLLQNHLFYKVSKTAKTSCYQIENET